MLKLYYFFIIETVIKKSTNKRFNGVQSWLNFKESFMTTRNVMCKGLFLFFPYTDKFFKSCLINQIELKLIKKLNP